MAYGQPMGQRRGSVLVVDDDPVIRQLIAVNLDMEGFEVTEAADGDEGISRALDVHPDVVTLDVMMPRMDGWVAAVRLRNDPRTKDIRIVLVTARAQRRDAERGKQIGVDAYLSKPFDPVELLDVVGAMAGERVS